jgi:NAD+ diphosphatase
MPARVNRLAHRPSSPVCQREGVQGANTFSGSRLDRAGARRTDEQFVAALQADPDAQAIAVTAEAVLVTVDPEPRLARLPLAELTAINAGQAEPPYLLGIEDTGAGLFAVDIDGADPAELPASTELLGLRDAGALLSQEEGGLVAQASGLANWHRRHPRCSVCGAGTVVKEAGYVRHCPSCGATHHPRTDPVVIMLVTDGGRALLGRQARWPTGRYSALAGFVEPGETLEEAVRREVREEAGVEIEHPRYESSQPWPFPTSLMLGFTAAYASGEATIRDEELEDVRWFTRDELLEARESGDTTLHLPPPLAIARRLIDGWLDDDDGDRPGGRR